MSKTGILGTLARGASGNERAGTAGGGGGGGGTNHAATVRMTTAPAANIPPAAIGMATAPLSTYTSGVGGGGGGTNSTTLNSAANGDHHPVSTATSLLPSHATVVPTTATNNSSASTAAAPAASAGGGGGGGGGSGLGPTLIVDVGNRTEKLDRLLKTSTQDTYEVIKTIGRGNFGVVHLCRAHSDGKLYVMKQIDLNDLSKSERDGALQEVKLLARLRHPFIVTYRESFLDAKDVLHIIMAYCEGGDLTSKIKAANGVHFPEEVVVDWFVQLALALQFCHSRKIIHRDLKSQNVFLTKKDNIRLGDFGIARVLGGTNELAMSVVGTPYSMSPEVCENKPYGFKSDIWALGCVLYEMCVLKHAFDANNLLGLVWKIVQEQYPPIPEVYSDNLRQLINGMLNKDPTKRPTIDEILALPFVRRRLHEQIISQTNTLSVHHKTLTRRKHNSNRKSQQTQELADAKRQSQADADGAVASPTKTTSASSGHSPPKLNDDSTAAPAGGAPPGGIIRQSSGGGSKGGDVSRFISPREKVLLEKKRQKEEAIAQRMAELKAVSSAEHRDRVKAVQRTKQEIWGGNGPAPPGSAASNAASQQQQTGGARLGSAGGMSSPTASPLPGNGNGGTPTRGTRPVGSAGSVSSGSSMGSSAFTPSPAASPVRMTPEPRGSINSLQSGRQPQQQPVPQTAPLPANTTGPLPPVATGTNYRALEDRPIKSAGRYNFDGTTGGGNGGAAGSVTATGTLRMGAGGASTKAGVDAKSTTRMGGAGSPQTDGQQQPDGSLRTTSAGGGEEDDEPNYEDDFDAYNSEDEMEDRERLSELTKAYDGEGADGDEPATPNPATASAPNSNNSHGPAPPATATATAVPPPALTPSRQASQQKDNSASAAASAAPATRTAALSVATNPAAASAAAAASATPHPLKARMDAQRIKILRKISETEFTNILQFFVTNPSFTGTQNWKQTLATRFGAIDQEIVFQIEQYRWLSDTVAAANAAANSPTAAATNSAATAAPAASTKSTAAAGGGIPPHHRTAKSNGSIGGGSAASGRDTPNSATSPPPTKTLRKDAAGRVIVERKPSDAADRAAAAAAVAAVTAATPVAATATSDAPATPVGVDRYGDSKTSAVSKSKTIGLKIKTGTAAGKTRPGSGGPHSASAAGAGGASTPGGKKVPNSAKAGVSGSGAKSRPGSSAPKPSSVTPSAKSTRKPT